MTSQDHNDWPDLNISYAILNSRGPSERLWVKIDRASAEEPKIWYQRTAFGDALSPQFHWQLPGEGKDFRIHPIAEVEQELVAGLVTALADIKTTVIPSGEYGFDGTSYELQIANANSHVGYHWWEELPRQWTGLKPALKLLKNYLHHLYARREDLQGHG